MKNREMGIMKFMIRIQIHSCYASMSSDDVFLYREIDLPFCPQIGMSFFDEKQDHKIVDICIGFSGEIRIYVEPDMEYYWKGRTKK